MPSYIINPTTGKRIRVGGPTFQKLVQQVRPRRQLAPPRVRLERAAKRSMKGKYLTRPSPAISATLPAENSVMSGGDGNLWINRANSRGIKRWVRLN